ncbi:MAG: hypothetical protein EOM91_10325 [Sphingobacteriia bacterium]|nr:hypothetical protein [Sphingobacteriia bacterium]
MDTPWFPNHYSPLSGDPLGSGEASGPLVQGGFSFAIGLAIGYAIKGLSRVALLVIGIAAISLFVLQYAQIIQVDWSTLEGRYTGAAAWFAAESKAFYAFMTGHLSNAAAFIAGFMLGIRR